jgi:hypothetical protein
MLDRGYLCAQVATPPLTLAVKMWPSPTASTGGPEPDGKTGRKLATLVKLHPTPSASMMTMQDMEQAQYAGNDPRRPAYGETKQNGSLNPAWVEWLMGYPLGWTDCADSETPSCRKSRRRSSPQ